MNGVKVLDFGLAKAPDAAAPADVSELPTITSPVMTGMGVILGTAAYMSPEQAKGRAVDKRADIWAFACVVYEMLTGRRAFGGETVTEVVAKILERDPDFTRLPANISPRLVRLLRRCLEKDPHRRLRDIGEARFELGEPEAPPEAQVGVSSSVKPLRLWQRPLPLATAIVTASIMTGLTVWVLMRPTPPGVMRVTMTPSGATALGIGGGSDLAISPDGMRLAYVGTKGTLVVRALDQLTATPLVGLGEPRLPDFSPDGQ